MNKHTFLMNWSKNVCATSWRRRCQSGVWTSLNEWNFSTSTIRLFVKRGSTCLFPLASLDKFRIPFITVINSQMNPEKNCDSLHSRKIMNRRRSRQYPSMIRIDARNNGVNLALQIGILIHHQTIEMKHLNWRSLHLPPIVADDGSFEFPGVFPGAFLGGFGVVRGFLRVDLHVFGFFDGRVFTADETFGEIDYGFVVLD